MVVFLVSQKHEKMGSWSLGVDGSSRTLSDEVTT